MSITSKVIVEDKKSKPFPKLMIAGDGDVYFFSQEKEGIKLFHGKNSPTNSKIGYTSNTMDMSYFIDFTGTVQLSNGGSDV